MKRKLIFWTVCLTFLFVGVQVVKAEEQTLTEKVTVDSTKSTVVKKVATAFDDAEVKEQVSINDLQEEPGFIQIIKTKIIDGGVAFMSIVLLCLILGLTVSIEKVIVLNLSSTNINSLLEKLKLAIVKGGLNEARKTASVEQGPVASVIAQALLRSDEGSDAIEKSIESYGSAEVTKLERGMSWIALFISLAPMFGFLGTVIGMISAFGTIKNSADIKIAEIAGGIETALLTTAAGLVVAAILQIFYNYCQAKIEDLTSQLEDGSNGFMNLVVTNNKVNKS
ncbi:MAG: biopolymer transport protein ExbB [Flavobacteriales bacterium]|jgi:biopolymer transport protein ExbB|tara:strand:+ start:8487 stop:9329 length:843 start_codon:yes stop_codon:yes gene_type:complete